MLDLEYGLPAQVRDTALGVTENVPKNEANREFFIATNKARLERGDSSLVHYDTAGTPEARTFLTRLAKKNSSNHNPDRNLAPPCSFYAKGKCTRGETCPYRHTLVAERYPSLQSYRNRYYGENDPAAKRILEQHQHLAKLTSRGAERQREAKAETFEPCPTASTMVITGLEQGDIELDDIHEYFESRGFKPQVRALEDSRVEVVLDNAEGTTAALQALGTTIEVNGVRLELLLKDNLEIASRRDN